MDLHQRRMNKDKYFLNKFSESSSNSKKDYLRTLFHLFKTLGYKETLDLSIPVFRGIVETINEQNKEVQEK